MKVYLVGGAVRDKLLGKSVKDRDWVVVGSTVEAMLNDGYRQVGKDFPVFLHPHTKEEYALARTERKAGHGYTGFTVHAAPEVTIEEDLSRRDLTINAIAMDESGEYIDPFCGIEDIKNKILRHVTDAFEEDPLRVLRVARFKARFHHLGFSIADETMTLMSKITDSAEILTLTPERVWTEVHRAIMEASPSEFFNTLRQCGALEKLFPEIDRLFGVPQRKEFHPEIDTGLHTMMVIDQAAKMRADAEVRFAALVHDLGKADTPEEILPRHIGHEARSEKRINQLSARLKIPTRFQQLARLVAKYHTYCHQAFTLKASTIIKLFESLDAFRRPERFEKFLLACKADALGRKGFEDSDYPQAEYFSELYDGCAKVDAKQFVDQGITGPDISLAIRRKRTQIIAMKKDSLDS